MAFQFAHIQTYSRKGNKTNRSVAEICAEAGRVPGHHPHVAEALPPTVIAGEFHPEQVPEEIERRVAEAKARLKGKTVKTRKVIRDDTHVLEAQVYSHPVYVRPAPAEHEGEERPCLENEADREAYVRWRNATVEFVYREGDRRGLEVLSIVEHLDEAHPHIHALLVPTNPQMNAKHSHPGHGAATRAMKDAKERGLPAEEMKAAAKDASPSARAGRKGGDSAKPLGRQPAAGKGKGRNRKAVELTEGKILQRIGNREYSAAMRQWQDLYNEEVGVDAGLLRYGPRRFRWSREEYMQRQQDARVVAKARGEAKAAEARRIAAEAKVREAEDAIGPGSKFRQNLQEMAANAVEKVDAAESELAVLRPELEEARSTIAKAASAGEQIESQRAQAKELASRIAAMEARAIELAAQNVDAEHLFNRVRDAQGILEEAEKKAAAADASAKAARAQHVDIVRDIELRRSADAELQAALDDREATVRAREDEAKEKERALQLQTQDIEAKAAGLEAWRKGEIGVRDGSFYLNVPKPDLRDRLVPIRDWLMAVIAPVEARIEAEVTTRLDRLKEDLRRGVVRAVEAVTAAWARNRIRKDAKGGLFIKAPAEERASFHDAMKPWPGLARSIFSKLPSLDNVTQAEKRALDLQALLTHAEDRDARNTLAALKQQRDGNFRSE